MPKFDGFGLIQESCQHLVWPQ